MNNHTLIEVEILSPQEISEEQRLEFESLVLEGGEVNAGTLRGLIDRAQALAIAQLCGALVGVAGVKRPYENYRNRVFSKAKVKLNPAHFEFELGWVYVHPPARGMRITSFLTEKLMLSVEDARIFATSRVDNERMHASLRRCGFENVGVPYPSGLNAPDIQLFVRK